MPQILIYLSDESPAALDLGDETITIGRLPDNTLQIEDASVSSHHAEIIPEDGQYRLRDLGSTNGTFINDGQIEEVHLNHGDQVRFGSIQAIYLTEEAGESQPLPQSSGLVAAVGSSTARPVDFVSTSPIKRTVKTKDGVGMALYAVAALAILAGVAAIYLTFSLELPA